MLSTRIGNWGKEMIEVYYYLINDKVDYYVECGLKLSEWASRTVKIDGILKNCIVALINPRDDMEKYKSDAFTCVKIRVDKRYCYVSEGCLYKAGLKSVKLMGEYEKSIAPAEHYVFGTYRQPEFLITTTIIGGNISIYNKKMGPPILYKNSAELYINNLVEAFREKYNDFNNNIMYYLFEKISSETSRFEKIVDSENSMNFYKDTESGRVYSIATPSPETAEWKI
jgi:hypothetical protein